MGGPSETKPSQARITDPTQRRARLWKEIASPSHGPVHLRRLERDLFPFVEDEITAVLAWIHRQTWDIPSLDLDRQTLLVCLCVGCELSLQETLKQLPGIGIRSDEMSRYFGKLVRSSTDELLLVQERTKYAILLTENTDQAARRRGYDILLDVSKTPSDWRFLSDLFGEPTVFNELEPGHIGMFLGRCSKEVYPEQFLGRLTAYYQYQLKAGIESRRNVCGRMKFLLKATQQIGSPSDLIALADFLVEWFTFDTPRFIMERMKALLPQDHALLRPLKGKSIETLLAEATLHGWTVLESDPEKLVLDKGGRRVCHYLCSPPRSLVEDESTDPETPEPKRSP